MKKIILLTFFFSICVFAKEDCSLKALKLDKDTNIAEQHFYTGTCHYRNKDYQDAVANWESLLTLESLNPDHENLKIDVLNNLGYMMFFGYGTEKNQTKAINYWQQAISMGHEEAEYHLCHAYADRDETTFNLPKAKQHCKKALLIYKGMDNPDSEILRQINVYMNDINSKH